MGDQHDRRAAGDEGGERVGERLLALHVDPGGRLVEDEEVRQAGEGAGDQHPLLLPAGQRRDAVAGLLAQADRVDRVLDRGPVLAPGRQERPAPRQPARGDDLAHGGRDAGAGADPLRHEADAAPVPEAVERGAEQPHLAAAGGHQPEHGADQGRLAGAVGAEDGEHLAGPHDEVDAAQHRTAAELDGAVGDGHDGIAHEHWFAFRRAARFARIRDR